jgi:hypothetical protein
MTTAPGLTSGLTSGATSGLGGGPDGGPDGGLGAVLGMGLGKGLEVRGGSGGLSVALADLWAVAAALRTEAAEVGRVARRLAGMAASWDAVRLVLESALPPLAAHPPVTAVAALAEVEWRLLRAAGPSGAAGEEAQLLGLAASVAAAVRAYQSAEAAAAATVRVGQDLVMGAAGVAWPFTLVGAVGLGVATVAGQALGGGDPLFEHPWLVALASGGVDGLVAGASASDPRVLALVVLASLARGRPWPPQGYEAALEALAALAAAAGWLREPGRFRVSRVSSEGVVAPRSLAGLMSGQEGLGESPPGRVRVVQVPQPDGSSAWILQVPGTQQWRPAAGANPLDLTSDVRLLAQETAVLTRAAGEALDQGMAAAGRVHSGDPVMLVGHSLGGIAAASLACSPEFTAGHRVTHVVTAGSPIARFPVPPGVTVLSLEHRQDAVPHLEGARNPDLRSWVTVTRDVAADPEVQGRLVAAHEVGEYTETAHQVDLAVRQGSSPSLVDWAAGSRAFFAGSTSAPAVVREFLVERSRS